MSYKDELQRATDLLASNGYLFLGQNMKFGGTSLFHMVKHLPESQRYELPVFEETQMGISAGLTLTGLKICSVFPRMDFLICGFGQLVGHLDKIKEMSDSEIKLKGLIIRTAIGSIKPLFPGAQHSGDYCESIQKACKEVKVVKLEKAEQIYISYEEAMNSESPTILVEIPDLYNQELTNDLIESRKGLIR